MLTPICSPFKEGSIDMSTVFAAVVLLKKQQSKGPFNSISIELNEMRGRGCRGAAAEVQKGPMTCWSVCLLQIIKEHIKSIEVEIH